MRKERRIAPAFFFRLLRLFFDQLPDDLVDISANVAEVRVDLSVRKPNDFQIVPLEFFGSERVVLFPFLRFVL